MEALKRHLIRHFELAFVVAVLVSVAVISHLVPYKLAFLNFFYIPVLLSAYYLGTRMAILGAIFSVIMVSIYATLFPEVFVSSYDAGPNEIVDLVASIVTWACFLILTGAFVGYLNRKLKEEIFRATTLSGELASQKAELEATTKELKEHTENLEVKVAERTEGLRKSKEAVEELKQKVEEALYSTMDPSVVKLMIERRLRTEKRKISVLLCDLQGFTNFSEERRPEVVVTELNRLFRDMEDVLLEYHAHIDKYMGDAILAEFGAPVDHEHHALLAITAGLKMQEALQRGNYPWQMRVAITTGEAIVGLIGHKRQSYTALGDVVNLASRVEKLCTPGKITIDEATYENVKAFCKVRRKPAPISEDGFNTTLLTNIDELLRQVEAEPNNFDLNKRLGFLCRQANDLVEAHRYLKKAAELSNTDMEVKLAYADVALHLEGGGNIAIRGKKRRIHLYEIEGMKEVLTDRERVPVELYTKYSETVRKLVDYPEDLILPVECIDASVGHSRVVGLLSYSIADMLDLPDLEKKQILEAAYLAEIGKTIVPHHILNHAEQLTELELEEYAKHCREGARKLKQMGYDSQPIFDIVTAHHENFNGTGYPAKLSRDQIPLGARIVAVANAYAELTSWRPTRDRWEYRAAFSELQRETAQGKYDPKIIECLQKLLGIAAKANK